jgi:hypothetical protein
VIEAKDLVARDKRGFSNPYVVVKYGKQKCTTRTVFKNLNPRWREHFLLYAPFPVYLFYYLINYFFTFTFDLVFAHIWTNALHSNVKQEEAHKLWLTVWDYNVIGSGEFLVRLMCVCGRVRSCRVCVCVVSCC